MAQNSLIEIDASLQELLIGNQKCDNADDDDADDDGVLIPMCRLCFAGGTKRVHVLHFASTEADASHNFQSLLCITYIV